MEQNPAGTKEKLLEVKNLSVSFETAVGEVRAVQDVSFDVQKGMTHCLVGESGCGKTVTSLSLLRLLPEPIGRIVSGELWFEGRNLLSLSHSEMRRIRGRRISMIFQEPMSSLNPVFRVGSQIMEAIKIHQSLSNRDAREQAIELLRMVGISAPEKRVDDYPHQLSGGMRQRVMIAMALSCHPSVLIADEPTTALDVTVQAQILDLLRDLQQKTGMGLILITHDLGIVAEMAEQVSIMYAGQVVESGSVRDIFENPASPYTRGLLNSIPTRGKSRLEAIPGIVPNLLQLPKGCRFQDRCSLVGSDCREAEPELKPVAPGHLARCFRRS